MKTLKEKDIIRKLDMILRNQRNIMIWIGKGEYNTGYFADNIKAIEMEIDYY